MTIARLTGQDAKGTGGAGSATATYPGATTSGNLLVASAMGVSGTDTLAITGWTKGIHGEGGSTNTAIFYKVADGTETAVQVTGGTGATRIHIYEYSGAANPIILDGTNSATNAAATSAPGASITTTNATDLVFASIMWAATVTAPSATAPFGNRQSDVTIRLFDADQIVSSTAAYTAGWSWTTSAQSRNCIIAFKAANLVTGSVAGVSATSGTVTALMAGSGTTAAVSAVSGAVTLLATASGTVAGVSGQTGAPTALLGVSGSVAGVSGTSGSSTLLAAVSGAVAAVSGAAGTIAARFPVSAVVQAVSAVAGSVTALLQAAGTVVGISSTRGDVQRQIPHVRADDERLTNVPVENRVVAIAAENRVVAIPAENRYEEVS